MQGRREGKAVLKGGQRFQKNLTWRWKIIGETSNDPWHLLKNRAFKKAKQGKPLAKSNRDAAS